MIEEALETGMKLRLVDFKEGVPTAVHGEYDPKTLDLEFVDLKYTGPLDLEGTVEKGLDTLIFRGRLTSGGEHLCGRCLKPAQDRLAQDFEFFYEIKGREVIETLDDLREVLILNHPISFVCSERCRGLCPECGADWNEAACGCAKKSHPVPLSPLAKLKIQLRNPEEKNHG